MYAVPFSIALFTVLLVSAQAFELNVFAEDAVWQTDIESAIELAKTEDKDLLLFYTGSDWCPPCKKLVEEVFEDEEFLREASRKFVLVEFDFPREKKLPEETATQNRIWSTRFGVEGYPTVILVDQDQRPYGITGYREGGAENYLAILSEFNQQRIRRDEALAKAADLEGEERAKMLDQALSELDPKLAELYYEELVREIVEIDKEDAQGLRTKWNASKDSEMRKIIMTDIVMVSRLEKPPVAIKFIDEVLAEINFPAHQLLQILQIKLNLLRRSNQIEAMDKLLDAIVAMPELTEESRQRMLVKKILLMVGTQRRGQGIQLLDESLAQAGEFAPHLWLAKGQLLAADSQHEAAIVAFDSGINGRDPGPDILIELFGAKADSYMSLGNELRAIQTLDKFSEDKSKPADLRVEAMLQKAMIMRDLGRERQATLVENSAIEIAETPEEQTEVRKLVERLRKKQGD